MGAGYARRMPRANLEIKAACADLDAARARAKEVATSWVGVEKQVDTYFVTRRGRLKLRESSREGGQLVPYLRPDTEGPKRSDYALLPVAEPAALKALLTAILGVHRVVTKEREIALYENVRIHLDRVEGLGSFVELEAVFDGEPGEEAAQQEKVAYLCRALGIRDEDRIAVSYEGLLGEA
jgi:adenylate cyclase class 2